MKIFKSLDKDGEGPQLIDGCGGGEEKRQHHGTLLKDTEMQHRRSVKLSRSSKKILLPLGF